MSAKILLRCRAPIPALSNCTRAPSARNACTCKSSPHTPLSHRHGKHRPLQSVFIRAAPDALVESSLSPTGGAFLDFVGFTLIVDDIVFPDGHTEMALLGGGGPQTLWGYMLIASNLREDGPARVGLLAGIGADLPEKIADWFTGMGIDTNGMYETTHPTPRAWQILEADGRRTQVWRSEPSEALYSMLRPDLRLLPSAYCQASVYHLGINPTTYDLEYLLQIKALARDAATRGNDDDDFNRPMSRVGLLSIEPFVAVEGDEKLTQEKLAGLCSVGDVFSPNETEAFSLVGPGTPLEVIDRLVEAGARLVLLRRGPQGSMVHDASTGETWEVPAVPESVVVDPTGCGNAYCGGFLAAWSGGESLVDAACWGSVAASFMVAVRGLPEPPLDEGMIMEANRRFEITKEEAWCLRPARA